MLHTFYFIPIIKLLYSAWFNFLFKLSKKIQVRMIEILRQDVRIRNACSKNNKENAGICNQLQ